MRLESGCQSGMSAILNRLLRPDPRCWGKSMNVSAEGMPCLCKLPSQSCEANRWDQTVPHGRSELNDGKLRKRSTTTLIPPPPPPPPPPPLKIIIRSNFAFTPELYLGPTPDLPSCPTNFCRAARVSYTLLHMISLRLRCLYRYGDEL